MFDNKPQDTPVHDVSASRGADDLVIDLFDAPQQDEYDADKSPTRAKRVRKPIKRQGRRVIPKGSPKAPTNFRAEADPDSSNRINLSWDDPDSSFLTYTIQQRQSNLVRMKWITINSGLAGNTFIDKNALSGFGYEYRIFATDEHGRSGQFSKRDKAKARVSISPIKHLWNTTNDEIRQKGLSLDRLCLLKALEVSRKYDKDRMEQENRALGLYATTKVVTEERIIRDAGEAFADLSDVAAYLQHRDLPKADRDDAHLLSLRKPALTQALAAYALAGVDLLSKLGGYVYETAKHKLVDEIARDRNINNECEHTSKADREARRNDLSKPQPFSQRMNADAVFGGRVRSPERAYSLVVGNSKRNDSRTVEEKQAFEQFRDASEAKERSMALAFDTSGRHERSGTDNEDDSGAAVELREEAIQPDFTLEPSIIDSTEAWQAATAADVAMTIDVLGATLPANERVLLDEIFFQAKPHAELAAKYEGSSDLAAIKRIQRRKDRAIAAANEHLTRSGPNARLLTASLGEWMNLKGKPI